MLEVTAVPAIRDNYIWLIHGRKDRSHVAIVDPGDAAPVVAALAHLGLVPAAILLTHRHWDHTDGVPELVARYGLAVYGPAKEAGQLVDHPCHDGDALELAALGLRFTVLEIPGHTLGHIAFHGHGALFCGDTLFSGGCGRLFEGTPEQMTASLERLAALSEDTLVYCGHEYTAANLNFAATVEPGNTETLEYRERVAALRQRNAPTLPSRIGLERAVNPFLRICEPAVRTAVEEWSEKQLNDKVRVFAALRRWKDEF